MVVTDEDRLAAEAWMREDTSRHPKATAARYDRRVGRIVVTLDNGLELMFPPRRAQGLEHAKPAELADIEVSPSGLGLHWPALDADLYVPALLAGVFGSRKWMEARAKATETASPPTAASPGARPRTPREAARGR